MGAHITYKLQQQQQCSQGCTAHILYLKRPARPPLHTTVAHKHKMSLPLSAAFYSALPCREPLIGFKAIPSGDIGVNAASVRNGKTRANGVSSGQYTFYQDPNALDVGYQTAPANAMSFTQLQDCMSACDNDVQ